jgi:hypothetical protein
MVYPEFALYRAPLYGDDVKPSHSGHSFGTQRLHLHLVLFHLESSIRQTSHPHFAMSPAPDLAHLAENSFPDNGVDTKK